jgi:hypothetical protein
MSQSRAITRRARKLSEVRLAGTRKYLICGN